MSGNPCDPNNPDGEEEDDSTSNRSEEDENVPQNYPRRPVVAQQRPRVTAAPTTRAPTTVFQTRYNAASDEEDDGPLHFAQIPKTTPRPAFFQQTQRPRIQVIQTTPAPQTQQPINYASPTPSINITPKPLYKFSQSNALPLIQQTQEPATTYRPHTLSIVTQKQVPVTTPQPYKSVSFSQGGNKGAIDFDAEFKKFQQETGFQPITSSPSHSTQAAKGHQGTTSNPIYQTQLIYNPATGQFDSNLYQSIPQTDGNFELNQRIQPYSPPQQYQIPQQQQQQPQYYRPQPSAPAPPRAPAPLRAQPQVPQQIYQKQQNELQFLNSQQLFAQQLQMQQSQLQRDRNEAARKTPAPSALPHRFQLGSEQSPILHRAPNGQQFYYIQPNSQSSGQIDAFLRGQNLEY